MSKFLESLVRSEGKSCAGKIKFPREDSAVRAAAEMTTKRTATDEIFEHYKCEFCEGWHIGHRTNFDWIPESHKAYTLMINSHLCTGKCNGKNIFLTSTVISNRIMIRFPGIADVPEIGAICPKCKSKSTHECRRIFVSLAKIPEDSKETVESLWNQQFTTQ
jgi:hypothetical protein